MSTTDTGHDAAPLSGDISASPVERPAAFPGIAVAGGVLGLVLLAAAGVLIRDLLARAGVVHGDTWTHRAAQNLGGQTWADWMWVIPAVCLVVGLSALWLALKPRRQTHLALDGYPVVWTRPVDVARRVSAAVSDLPGVREAVTVIRRRSIVVTVIAAGAVAKDDVVRRAAQAAQPVTPGKPVKVRIRDQRKEADE